MNAFRILPKLSFFGFLLFLLTACNLSEESGRWGGSMIVRDDHYRPYTCEVEVEISRGQKFLILHHITNSCAGADAKWHVGRYDIEGNEIWRNGRYAGRISADDTVRLELNDALVDERIPYANHGVVISWQRIGDSLHFTEESSFGQHYRRSTGWLRRTR